ncbi:hypothetical protein B0T10DRAFT_316468 [Thelonectria olida]|uniref:Pentatricopeptide repeat-containing protein n=1 Tax=Thelonectria olida TaxID=1576542 RepID=A0A9P9AMH3_9HYPO|nr:hypothetical protein B0T10DRAFT_316468 [Thelonectria olida]
MAESILSCGTCLRRAIQHLPQHRVAIERAALLQTLTLQPTPSHPRFRSTLSSTPSSETAKAAIAGEQQPPNGNKSTHLSVAEAKAAIAADPDAVSPKRQRQQRERNVMKHLSWLDDPWHIAQHVSDLLEKNRYDEALLMTQKASAKYQVEVSWNHLIEYLLREQQLRNAIKLYNDMKKRGQLPNLQTFTIMFSGFAKSQHPKLAVAEALKHYQILLNDTRLQPNATHLNAVINVCARAGDLDSMFSVVETMNESTRAADPVTYTIILNALRHHAQGESRDLPSEQRDNNIAKAISRAKLLWREAVDKWRRSRLLMDESMVCAFGRLLIMAPDRVQKREVFDLLEQTMNIPNLTKPEVAARVDSGKGLSERGKYVVPGTNTLALVLTSLASSRMTTVGIKYWNLMVRDYGIVPDRDCWMRLFGMLKTAKASAHAAEILDVVPDDLIDPLHYRIALETCVRDNINQNAVKNSNKALASMMKRLKLPDPHSLRLYLRVALVSHYQLRSRSEDGDHDRAKRDYGMQIAEALDTLWKPYQTLHNYYFTVSKNKDEKSQPILYNNQREVIALARIMYSSYNKILQQGMLPEDDLKAIRRIGARINREIQAFFANREEVEPNLRKSKGRSSAEEDMTAYGGSLGGPLGGDFEWDTTAAGRPSKPARDERMRRRGGGTPRSRWEGRRDEETIRSRWEQHQDHRQPPEFRGIRDPQQRRGALPW